ncbi:hypothetical protein [Aliiroseovarius crassostreae]|uniref:hypothetical protein n=1 Tax=Aliiroseovarius crassostreae TaxID=154981 RepID=UPI003C7A00B1
MSKKHKTGIRFCASCFGRQIAAVRRKLSFITKTRNIISILFKKFDLATLYSSFSLLTPPFPAHNVANEVSPYRALKESWEQI